MTEETVVTQEFQPQFRLAFIHATYRKFWVKTEKRYVGSFVEQGRVVKFTRMIFKRASEAENYAKAVFEKYSRLIIAKRESDFQAKRNAQ